MKMHNPSRRFDYILQADRDSQSRTTFVLRRLTWEELGEYQVTSPFTPDQSRKAAQVLAAAEAEGREPTEEEISRLEAVMPISADYMLQITAAYARALRYGLVEIRDLQDEHGEPMPLPVPDFIRGAPGSIIQELGQELMRISRLSETERKNFSAPREPGRAAATAASARAKTRSPATAT